MRSLYIIGNGFDLHHQIPSSYRAFGEYLQSHDRNTYDVVERYFDVDADFWADFEERLASFDGDTLIADASEFLVGYGAEDWSDAYHHDYQFEISQSVDAVSAKLMSRFAEWIRQLPIPERSSVSDLMLSLDSRDNFLNFNYTPTLQRLYDVPDSQILHIHGAATSQSAQLVLGHGWEPPAELDPYRVASNPEDADIRVVEGQRIIDDYFKKTFKPTAQIIRDNDGFFAGLSPVERIFVMGHSISTVDHPYFREVIRSIDADRVRWKISYFGDPAGVSERVQELGIPSDLVEYALLTQF